jgi:uncharacterized membrane protein
MGLLGNLISMEHMGIGMPCKRGGTSVLFCAQKEHRRPVSNGKVFGLIPVVSASWARYQAGDGSQTGSWSKGERASVSKDGKVLPECQAIREPKRPFTVLGQEPGWMITIDTSTIFLKSEYGALQLNMARTEPQATAEGIHYSTEEGGRRLEVFIRQEVCADVATGMPHSYQVRFELDGQGHAGCGGEWTVQTIDGVSVVEESEATG